jgi:uncharacterized protein (TIGR01244 family)
MDIRRITPDYAVSPQIEPEDLPEIAAQGLPDGDLQPPRCREPAELSAEVMRIAPRPRAALRGQPGHAPDHDARADRRAGRGAGRGPVLAYCASGTRSSVLWSLAQAGRMPADEILGATARAGYDLSGLRPGSKGQG